MNKLILFAIFAILIAPNAWAAETEEVTESDCTDQGKTYCPAELSGSKDGCCLSRGKVCMKGACGYEMIELENPCPDECPSTTSYTSASGNRSARCFPLRDGSYTCHYQCNKGYFGTKYKRITVAMQIILYSMTECTACPDNATCSDGSSTEPICNKDYYLSGKGANQVCNRCPEPYKIKPDCPTDNYPGGNPIQVRIFGQTTGPGSTSITDCYIEPGNYYLCDETGWYDFADDCEYTN